MPAPTNGKDRLVYGDGDDRGGNESLYTFIDLLGGNDTVFAGGGNDFFSGGVGKDRLHGEAGDDALYGGTGDDELHGGDGDDFLNGGGEGEATDEGKDALYGGAGNDVLFGGGGKDRLYGDDDDDQLDGGLGDDQLHGGSGDDELAGGEGKDVLDGGDGDDELGGGAGNDRLKGGGGIDIMWGDGRYGGGPGGDDTLDGGAGIDYAVFRGNVSDYRITTNGGGVTTVQDLRSAAGSGVLDGKDRLTGVERLVFDDETVSLSDPDTNATFAGAAVITAADLADGVFTADAALDLPDDVDIWRVFLTAGQTVTAFTDPVGEPRTNIAIYDGMGRFLALNWDDDRDDPDEGLPDLTLIYTAQTTGDHYVAIAGYAHIPSRDDDPSGPHYQGFSGQSGDYVFNLTA
ncbi:calcium-binding protein [Roseomonas sp. CCTCC AB2023176]|uniref:calcium-binding protein n=1 Tax=Roseomonas sp. CCTCC AB2023176 TaxID=3342640 RepID=UPI0035E1165C